MVLVASESSLEFSTHESMIFQVPIECPARKLFSSSGQTSVAYATWLFLG